MTITLTNGATSVALPDDLSWSDEFTWQQVLQSSEYTTTGALLLDAFSKQAGRPITLSGDTTFAWCQRGDLLTLRNWASQAGLMLTLTLRGVSRAVVFNHDAGALEAESVLGYSDPLDSDPYALTIRFLEL